MLKGWKGPYRSSSHNPPDMCRDSSHKTRLLKTLSSLALNAVRVGASTTSLGNLFQYLTKFHLFQFVSIGPCPTTTVPDKAPLWPPCRPPSDTGRLQCNLLSSGLNNSVSLFVQGMCSHPLCGPHLDLLLQFHVLLMLGTPELYTVFQGVSQKHRS